MKATGGTDDAKRAAGESAADLVEDGDVVGLGTGSTAAWAIRALGRRVDDGLDVAGVPTSYQSRQLARDEGIPLTTLEAGQPDIAIDGADQVADRVAEHGGGDADGSGGGGAGGGGFALVKGGGAAHAREKVVDAAAERFVVVADPTKLAAALTHAVPLEVLPDATPAVERAVRDAGGEPSVRAAERKDGPVVTDNGNLVLDCDFGTIDDPGALARRLNAVPGAVEHGLFVGLADELHIGTADGDVDVRTV